MAKSLISRSTARSRDEEACYESSAGGSCLAKRLNTRLHILHLLLQKRWSCWTTVCRFQKSRSLARYVCIICGLPMQIIPPTETVSKWNPSVKTLADREALIEAVNNNKMNIGHRSRATHLLSEKGAVVLRQLPGGPLVQHSVVAMLELAKQGRFTVEGGWKDGSCRQSCSRSTAAGIFVRLLCRPCLNWSGSKLDGWQGEYPIQMWMVSFRRLYVPPQGAAYLCKRPASIQQRVMDDSIRGMD